MSSHREAPEISKDPVADNADLYAFVSPDDPDTVTIITNFVPLRGPRGGPNFFEFGDDVLYSIYIDNDGDADPDIIYQFQFETQVANPNTFLYNTGPIRSLTDPNWNRRQFYSVTSGSTTAGRRPRCSERASPARRAISGRARPRTTRRWPRRRFTASRAADRVRRPADEGSTSTSGRSSTSATCGRSRTCTRLPLPALRRRSASTHGRFNVHSIAIKVPIVGSDRVTARRRPTRLQRRR